MTWLRDRFFNGRPNIFLEARQAVENVYNYIYILQKRGGTEYNPKGIDTISPDMYKN